MSYWKSKVLPRLKNLLKTRPKSQSVEACKSFDKSKDSIAREIEEKKEELQTKVDSIAREIEEKKEELQTKVVTIYQSSSNEAKGLLKDPTEPGVIELIEVVQNLLIELSDAGCPGAQFLSDAATKHGPSAVSEPIVFLLSKLTVFVAAEEYPFIPSEEPKTEQPAAEATPSLAMQDAAPPA